MRQAIFTIHKYLGFTVGAYLIVICATGAALVFLENQISDFRDFPMKHVQARPKMQSLDAILATADRAYPASHVTHILESCDSGCTYDVSFAQPDGGRLDVLVDPYTAHIVGSVLRSRTAIGRLYEFHANLFAGDEGSLINSAIGSVALLLVLTGAYMWPGWKRPSRGFSVKWTGGRWRVNFDIHKIVGIVSVAFLVLIIASGIGGVFVQEPPVTQSSSTPAHGNRSLLLDQLVADANEALPGTITMVYPPATADSTVVVREIVAGDPDPYGWSYVSVDRFTGRVVAMNDATKWPLAWRAYMWLYPLHIGSAGGYALRFVYVLVAFAPVVLYLTAFLMWLKRLEPQRPIA
ncbi:MAG TPA: PepSY-associated TM helix domain-containing protein [Candidatus Eremiobacteraceae bacterium]|nr:PepSY-associated TM helix domain-containing protein [Candidatus Eremiobacteraceae bacterium]